MNFDFSQEQEELRRQAQRVLGTTSAHARAALTADRGHDPALWQQVVELGWPAAAIPEDHGGLGLGPLELCVLAEEFGRSLAPVPFVASVLHATEALKLVAAANGVAAETLGALAEGRVVATVAFVEPHARLWTDTPSARVVDGRLSGVKSPVSDAQAAGLAVVSALDADGGVGLWLVDLRQPGVKRVEIDGLDRLRRSSRVEFEGAAAQRLDQPGQAAGLLQRLTGSAAITTAFEQLGAAEAVLAMSLDYVRQRKAFAREIGTYQAVKHKLADMYVKNQLARSHAYYGAWALANDDASLARAAAGARLAALDALAFAAEETVELHGGIGFTWEHDAQLYYRRARLLAVGLGGRQVWAQQLVASLGEESAAPAH